MSYPQSDRIAARRIGRDHRSWASASRYERDHMNRLQQ